MDFQEVLRRRRMVRAFEPRPIPPDLLRRVLGVLPRTPTAGNTEGLAVLVLEGPEQTRTYWSLTTTEDWRSRSRRWPGLAAAPVIVLVLTSADRYLERYAEPDKVASGLGRVPSATSEEVSGRWPVPYWFVDAGQAIYGLLLGAVDAGLGACLLGTFRGEEALRRALGVPPAWRVAGAVLLGWPAGTDPRSPSLDRPWRRQARLDPGQLVHWGRWHGPPLDPSAEPTLPAPGTPQASKVGTSPGQVASKEPGNGPAGG
ncbi:nitroreductase family protein [Aciditerrimonas ferrireducens]|uniref:nitroreductase family protein n=1 Tax=Aciditerrimonas ferrireducens TaxID=667306 RepID=UPI002002E98E|nr:nitroreductase family protein [Aciditerrimonas ferrireducens]MCK4177410.1 nitroreductase family protein [Aciditerrimonas ferrireducens]